MKTLTVCLECTDICIHGSITHYATLILGCHAQETIKWVLHRENVLTKNPTNENEHRKREWKFSMVKHVYNGNTSTNLNNLIFWF